MPDTFTTNAKEVLRNGQHFADAVDAEAAEQIVAAFNDRASIAAYLEAEGRNQLRTKHFRRLLSVLADNVRARLDRVEVAPAGERARYNGEAARG